MIWFVSRSWRRSPSRVHAMASAVLPPVMSVAVAMFAGGCGMRSCGVALPVEHDLVSASQIGHHGCRDAAAWPNDRLFVFPSQDLVVLPSPVESARVTIVGFLKPHFALKTGVRFAVCDGAEIGVESVDPNTGTVVFGVSDDARQAIRRLDFDGFCRLQRRFEWWMFRQVDGWFVNPFFLPLDRFAKTADYQEKLRGFWLDCLTSADVRIALRPPPRWVPVPEINPDRKRADVGAKMGAIPLEPGMRLLVYWGGTAVYPSTSGPQPARQTTVGMTPIDVVARDGRVTLDLLRFASPTLPPVAIESIAPKAPINNLADHLPYGGTPLTDRRLVPVNGYLDLLHIDALRKQPTDYTAGHPVPPVDAVAPHLTLMIPASYTKSEMSRKEGDPGYGNTLGGTNDSVDEKSQYTLEQRIARRYMIWGSGRPFIDPVRDAPKLVPPALEHWEYAPLVFGNQTAVEVQVPLSLNTRPAEYVPLGTTWGDVLDVNARWLSGDGLGAVVVRSIPDIGPIDSGYRRQVFRIRAAVLPALRGVEVRTGDAIFYSGRLP